MPHRHYTQLSLEERIIIENRLANGETFREIARAINRSPSTISREISRNSKKNKRTRVNIPHELYLDSRHYRGTIEVDKIRRRKKDYRDRIKRFRVYNYSAKESNKKALSRTKEQELVLSRADNADILAYVLEKLHKQWSPETISGRLYLAKQIKISPKSIYKYVYASKDKKLINCLPRKNKHHVSPVVYTFNKTNRDKHNISERPEIIDNLGRIGDLEGDTIFGKDSKDRILTHVDRKTSVLAISLILGYNADKVAKQAIKDIRRVFGEIKSITYDNGVEFTNWKEIEKNTGSTVYFANPYHSWERGRNENANGLIRRFFPKGTDFKKLKKSDIMKVESLLNNRPRKRLGWLTPLEYAKKLSVALEGSE